MPIDPLVTAMPPLLHKPCDGGVSIAIGGSRTKESADRWSDLDVYLFSMAVLPRSDRETVVSTMLPNVCNVNSWGCDDPFLEGGTDFTFEGVRVECWHRREASVEEKLHASLNGEIRRQYSAWAVMGFFDHAVLADIRSMHIVVDPQGTLARWKKEVSHYPEALRRSLLHRFMREAAFWPNNPHYQSAVERVDLIYATAIVQHTIHALIQVLFALNQEYFPRRETARPCDGQALLATARAVRLDMSNTHPWNRCWARRTCRPGQRTRRSGCGSEVLGVIRPKLT